MARRLPETFLEDFLLPLVEGGEVIVGAPIDAEDLVALRAECATISDISVRIENARQDVAALTWLYPVSTVVDNETLDLAVGIHNLLFLSHPAASRLTARKSRLRDVAEFSRACIARLGPPNNEDELVARHTVVAPFLEIERADVELIFWVGRRFYSGQKPPGRLLAWRGLRRVEERKRTVRWLETEIGDAQRDLVELLLWQSPLTALLAPELPQGAVGPTLLFPYLRHPRVSRRVCQHYLERGIRSVEKTLANDFWEMVKDPRGRLRALTSEKLSWSLSAFHHWGADPASTALAFPLAPDVSATDEAVDRLWAAQLPIRVIAGLVQYLYAASCLVDGPIADGALAEAQDPRDSLRSVLVAAADTSLLADASAFGDKDVERRFFDVIEDSRTAFGDAITPLTVELTRALAA